MIEFERFVLDNGLRLLIHRDRRTPIASMNLMYEVGSKYEDPHLTGLAHLFEHLMFEGSLNAPDFDLPMQMAGAEDNAYTNNDLTCYYSSLPAVNMEIPFWLEADRMAHLNINQASLDLQRNVVMEEFLETTTNKPYGKAWHYLSGMAYKVHPYRWPTIGVHTDHIKRINLDDLTGFYSNYYTPDNAVLSVVGDVDRERVLDLTHRWFDPIAKQKQRQEDIKVEPPQEGFRSMDAEEEVPLPALYLAFHMPERKAEDYYGIDLISDLLGSGTSSRLYQTLVKEQGVFSSIHSYITGVIDGGLLIIEGKIFPNIGIEEAEKRVWDLLDSFMHGDLPERELQKVKNIVESNLIYNETRASSIAHALSYYELLGDAHLINREIERYERVTVKDVQRLAQKLFKRDNCSRLRFVNY